MAVSARTRKRQYENAVKRETYLNRVDRPVKETVSKKPRVGVIYASSLIKKGSPGVSQEFIIQASERGVTFFGGNAALGLKSPATATDPLPPTPRFWVPAKVNAGVGLTSPSAKRSPWGTRVVKSKSANYSAPISDTIANVTFDSQQARARTIYNAIKPNLGDTSYATFYLSPEFYNNKQSG